MPSGREFVHPFPASVPFEFVSTLTKTVTKRIRRTELRDRVASGSDGAEQQRRLWDRIARGSIAEQAGDSSDEQEYPPEYEGSRNGEDEHEQTDEQDDRRGSHVYLNHSFDE